MGPGTEESSLPDRRFVRDLTLHDWRLRVDLRSDGGLLLFAHHHQRD